MTRKLAQCLDGIDVSQYEPGDVFELTRAEGELLIAEGWAEPHVRVKARVYRPRKTSTHQRARHAEAAVASAANIASDPAWSLTHTLDQLREVRRRLESRYQADGELRRAEDRIREELHESRAQVIYPDFGTSNHR